MNARAFTILALLAAAAAGCVDNDASVRIFAMCFPPTPTETGACSYPAACDALLLGGVEFNVENDSPDGALVWPVQVDNQRPPNADRSGGVETANAWIEGFRISYAIPGLSVPELDVPISRHPVLPGGSTVVIAPVVPSTLATFLGGTTGLTAGSTTMHAELKAYGSYGDGSTFETGPFTIVATAWKGGGGTFGAGCPDPSKPVLVGVCPQTGQTNVGLCVAPVTP